MSRRVVIGKKGNGQMGLAVSLPGIDVMSTTPSSPGLSFDDSMPVIVKIAQSGIVTTTTDAPPDNTVSVSHGLGFIPFIEARILSGSTIFDDIVAISNVLPSNPYSGVPCKIGSSNLVFSNIQTQLLNAGLSQPAEYAGYNAYYVVYNVAVPS